MKFPVINQRSDKIIIPFYGIPSTSLFTVTQITLQQITTPNMDAFEKSHAAINTRLPYQKLHSFSTKSGCFKNSHAASSTQLAYQKLHSCSTKSGCFQNSHAASSAQLAYQNLNSCSTKRWFLFKFACGLQCTACIPEITQLQYQTWVFLKISHAATSTQLAYVKLHCFNTKSGWFLKFKIEAQAEF